MQIITRRVNESIVVDAAITVTVVEVETDKVTLEIVESDGSTQQVIFSRNLECDDDQADLAAHAEVAHC